MIKEIDLERPPGRHDLHSALHDGIFLVRSTVTESLLEEAHHFLTAFFGLAPEEKQACRTPGSHHPCGYTPPPARPADSAAHGGEAFCWGSVLPAGHPLRERYPDRYPDPYFPDHLVPGIGSALRELHTRTLRFQHEVIRTLAGALGAHPDYFTDMLHEGPALNRAAWHPPAPPPHPAPAHCAAPAGAAEHQDTGLITTVPRPAGAGLEVRVGGQWLAADAPPGYAAVRVGLVLQRLTGGLARAAVHRTPARPGHPRGRLSLTQACHPAPWTTLTPLHVPGTKDRPQRYATLTAQDLFQRTRYHSRRPSAPPATVPAR